MAQPVSSPITSTPSVPGQPYSPTDHAAGRWVKLPSGTADIHTGKMSGGDDDWHHSNDSHWKQT